MNKLINNKSKGFPLLFQKNKKFITSSLWSSSSDLIKSSSWQEKIHVVKVCVLFSIFSAKFSYRGFLCISSEKRDIYNYFPCFFIFYVFVLEMNPLRSTFYEFKHSVFLLVFVFVGKINDQTWRELYCKVFSFCFHDQRSCLNWSYIGQPYPRFRSFFKENNRVLC